MIVRCGLRPNPRARRAPTAVSWTGGKDYNLALLMAWRDPTFRSVEPQPSSDRKTPPSGRTRWRWPNCKRRA